MSRIYYICLLLWLLAYKGAAQISISNTSNASVLVNNIVGAGVQVTNVTLNCNGAASGTFNSNGSNLGISSGVILATGAVTEATGPNNNDGAGESNGCFNSSVSFSDQNILSIEPEAKYDGCVLEFDVKPVCDILEVKYVFASEEYPEFVGAGYNDAFGFSIWGPNPRGANYAAVNIAQLPSSGTSVSIDNVNASSNSQYYVNNHNGSSIEYDGFTVPLTASVAVSHCEMYHLKFAIADAGDCQYSSAVFLGHSGVACPNTLLPQVSASSTIVSCGNDGTATASVTNAQGPITYHWEPGGQTTATATNLSPGTYRKTRIIKPG